MPEAQRQKARETALRLIAEGKFGGAGPKEGGTWGQRGRAYRPKFVPRPRELKLVLEAIEKHRDPGASDEVRQLIKLVPQHAWTPVRLPMCELLADSLASAIKHKHFVRDAVINRDGNVRLYWAGRPSARRPLMGGETNVSVIEPQARDFESYKESELADLLVLMSNRNVYPGDESRRVLDFLTEHALLFSTAARAVHKARKEARKEAVAELE